MPKRRVAVLGCTGSVGTQALSLLDEHRDRFEVCLLSANRSAQGLAAAVARHPGAHACLTGSAQPPSLPDAGRSWATAEGLLEALDAAAPDTVLNAITGAAGIPAYEISNHARPGEESRHNMTYWRYGDYAGIGPGAHGRRMAAATQRHRKPENWLAAIGRNGHGCQSETPLSAPERASEALMMGLRLAEGININTLSDRLDIAPRDMIDEAAVMRLSGHGLIERANGHLRITPPGMLLLDAILPQIMI